MDLSSQQYCLRWNNYQTNLTSVFDQLLQSEAFVDVTLTTGGKSIKCHKVVLSACSPYFQQLFFDNPCQHPIVILKDISWNDMRFVVEYMYKGEINVTQDQLGPLLKAAEALKVRGLVDVNRDDDMQDTQIHPIPGPPGLIPRWSMPEDLRVIPGTTPKKRRRLTADECTPCPTPSPSPPDKSEVRVQSPSQSSATPSGPTSAPPPPHPSTSHSPAPSDNLSDIRPDIMEMIKEEQRAKMMEASQNWMAQNSTSTASGSSVPGTGSCYQYQLQNMWQKCWNQNTALLQGMRYRERGPMKSWRPETMAEAIWSVLLEGLSLSQAARKHDIPYPTFVLYANRVHNMLGPSILNGLPCIGDLRPKGRGRPQRILLGQWPEDHVRTVIRSVVFREGGLTYPAPPRQTTPTSHAPYSSPHRGAPQGAIRDGEAIKTQLKSMYDNPIASQLLAASSKAYQPDMIRWPQDGFKQELTEGAFDDADALEDDEEETLIIDTEVDAKKDGGSSPGAAKTSIDAIVNRLSVTAVDPSRSTALEALAMNPDVILTELNNGQDDENANTVNMLSINHAPNHSAQNHAQPANRHKEKENRVVEADNAVAVWANANESCKTSERKFSNNTLGHHEAPDFAKLMDE